MNPASENKNQSSQQKNEPQPGAQRPVQPTEKHAPSQEQMPAEGSTKGFKQDSEYEHELDQDIHEAQVDESEMEDETSRPEDQIV